MRRALQTIGGLYCLARLAVISRFNFKSRYWSWRLDTAFGRGYPATRRELVESVLEYARWMWRMRRFL